MTPRRKATGRNQTDTSGPAQKDGVKRRPGRPPVHTESWTKVTVVLFDRQVRFLDRLADDIRSRHGAAISRAQLIRALVDSVGDSLDEYAGEGEPAARIAPTADTATDVDAGINHGSDPGFDRGGNLGFDLGFDLYEVMLARLGVGRRKD